MRARFGLQLLCLCAVLALVVSAPAYAVTAGITLDVHQDCAVIPMRLPNDFHVEGKICSKIGAPVLTSHVDGPFVPPSGTFSYTITKVVPTDPTDCWYTFTGDWEFGPTSAGVAYCTMHHFGLVFDVQAANVVINLVGWWTRDGVKIGQLITGNNFRNNGYVPVTGFDVRDDPDHGQLVRITNGIQLSPPFPPLTPAPPSIPIEIVAMDLISFPAGQQIPIDALSENGAQRDWPWIHAVDGNGQAIGTNNPMPLADSFFDVFLEMSVPGSPGLPPNQQLTIPPGGSLVARTQMRFTNNNGDTELKWQWDIHGQPSSPPCQWYSDSPAKWLQMPDVSPTGIDIRVDSADNNSRILADDFRCTQTGPITDVHFWGSWLNDLKGEIDRLTISFYSDVPDPDGTGPGFSKPGSMLWQHIFVPSQFSEKLYATLEGDLIEWFWDPFTTAAPNPFGDRKVWQYDICIDPAIAYLQQGTAANPIIYWLGIQVYLKTGSTAQFGWKTRDPVITHYGGGHFMDDAVWGQNVGGTVTWNDLHYPTGPPLHPLSPNSLDMAFVITGQTTAPPCCLQVDYGTQQPADHMFTCVNNDPAPNFMQNVIICNPCSIAMPISGLKFQAGGTGNLSSIGQIQVFLDANCDGIADNPFAPTLIGNYDALGSAVLCNPTGSVYTLPPGVPGHSSCVCFLIYYRMNCPATPGTYFFDLVSILGPNCAAICTTDTSIMPLRSAVKTVPQDCCPTIEKGVPFPSDHNYVCNPTVPPQPNFMAEYKLCNPCATDQCYYGLRLVAGGTGNDLTGVQSVMVSLDWNCDGKPDSINVLNGVYPADDGTLDLCKTGGYLCLGPGQCVCIRVYYIMKCDAPPGTYYFNLTALLGPSCLPGPCVEGLPILSATKTVIPPDCCLNVAYSTTPPLPDHTFVCPPVGADTPLNKMMSVRVCNWCLTDRPIYGFNLQAYGSGDDLTGITNVYVAPDMNCDGQDDSPPVPMGTYSADNGTLSYCQASGPIAVLLADHCGCFNFYYKMKCPDPVPGIYAFVLDDILDQNCQPICVNAGQLPLKSAKKTINPLPCCLDVTVGPNNPPSHNWWPGLPMRNRMFTFKIYNPCPQVPARITCLKLKASGTGDDLNDILAVRIINDLNGNGVVDIGEPAYGAVGPYSADNGTRTFSGATTISPFAWNYFIVEYIMKPWPTPPAHLGATYCMALTSVCATTTISPTSPICVNGLPLNSNCKRRCIKIGQIPWFSPGIVLCLQHKVITAVFQDRFYVQDQYGDSPESDPDAYGPSPDRGAGVAILGSVAAPVGSVVNIEGTTDVVNGEVVVRPTSVELLTDPVVEAKPLGMSNKNSAGGTKGNQPAVVDSFFDVFFSVQTNNVGLLMTGWGMVTDSDGISKFWIDDGSGLKDGSFAASGQPHVGMKVNATYVGWAPQIGSYVAVTGIMRAEDSLGRCIRVLYPRTRADIR